MHLVTQLHRRRSVTKFIFTPNYEKALIRIENYIYSTAQSIKAVESFLDEHDEALDFIAKNPKTPATHLLTGDQSWTLKNGRYRLFFKCVEDEGFTIYLLRLIDNKEANLNIYPSHHIDTYSEE